MRFTKQWTAFALAACLAFWGCGRSPEPAPSTVQPEPAPESAANTDAVAAAPMTDLAPNAPEAPSAPTPAPNPAPNPAPATPPANSDAAATPAPAPADALSVEYVGADFQGALVLRPAKVWESPMLEVLKAFGPQLDPATLEQMVRQQTGQDIRNLKELLVLFGLSDGPFGPAPVVGAVFRFDSPYDKAALLDRVEGQGAEKTDFDGFDAYTLPQGTIVFIDDRTLLAGQEQSLESMFEYKTAKSPLIDAMRQTSGNHDLVAVVALEELREPILEMAKQMPPVAPFAGLVRQINSLTLTGDLEGDVLASATVDTASKDVAEGIHALGRAMLAKDEATLAKRRQQLVDDFSRQLSTEHAEAAADLAIDFNRNISAEAEGAKLIARLNAPENWQERAKALAPALAEVAAKAAAQTESLNRLRMISLAIHNYHDAHVQLPPAATRDDDGKPLLSWRVALLPYIGEDELYAEFHLDEPWDSEHNKTLIERMPAIYGTSPTLDPGHTTILAVSGPDAMFGPEMGVKLHDVRDGLSNTVMIVIAAESKAVPWTKPSDLDPAAEDLADALGLAGENDFVAAFGDGSVRRLPKSIDLQTLRAVFTRSGGEVVELP